MEPLANEALRVLAVRPAAWARLERRDCRIQDLQVPLERLERRDTQILDLQEVLEQLDRVVLQAPPPPS